MNTIGYHNDGPGGPFGGRGGAYVSDGNTVMQDGKTPLLPDTALTGLPSKTVRAKVASVERNRNPIVVTLTDGTQMMFTWDEFRRINQEPAVGKTMTVVFQRLPHDNTTNASKINTIKVE